VLSFESNSPGYLGDIAMAYETACTRSPRASQDLLLHAAHLAMHGILHLRG
jgi:probable rRNA maturation factor